MENSLCRQGLINYTFGLSVSITIHPTKFGQLLNFQKINNVFGRRKKCKEGEERVGFGMNFDMLGCLV